MKEFLTRTASRPFLSSIPRRRRFPLSYEKARLDDSAFASNSKTALKAPPVCFVSFRVYYIINPDPVEFRGFAEAVRMSFFFGPTKRGRGKKKDLLAVIIFNLRRACSTNATRRDAVRSRGTPSRKFRFCLTQIVGIHSLFRNGTDYFLSPAATPARLRVCAQHCLYVRTCVRARYSSMYEKSLLPAVDRATERCARTFALRD